MGQNEFYAPPKT